MLERLPSYYRKSAVISELYDVIENYAIKHGMNPDDVFITKTSSFDRHLSDVGLSPAIDADGETKRAMVLSRLRGNETFTLSKLISLIKSYEDTAFEITEISSENRVIIHFTERKGMPRNFAQLKRSINDMKPAHIVFEYETQYVSWGQAAADVKTWGAAREYTWGDLSLLNTAVVKLTETED